MQDGASPTRQIVRIAVPVSIEMVIVLLLNFATQVIVGTLGALPIAAVGFANSLTFIIIVTVSAVGLSVAILTARAHGAGRNHEMGAVVTAAMLLVAVVSGVFAIAMALAPEALLRLVGASDAVAAVGAGYLRLTALSMVPAVLAAALSGVLRSTGSPRTPMVVTAATAALSALGAYALVRGSGPLPSLGVDGAGIAMLVTQVLKVAILLPFVFGRLVPWELPVRGEWGAVLRPLVVLAVPLAITELVWTVGTFLFNVVFQRLGDEPLAAAQIVWALDGLFIVGSLGLMTAASILISQAIGRGDADAALAWARRISRAGIVTGIGFGLLFALSCLALPLVFPEAGETVLHMAVIGILINAAGQFIKVRNMILGAGVLPAANDVRGVILGDAVATFVFGLPLALLLGIVGPLGVTGIFVARMIDECVKLGIFTWRARRIDWPRLARTSAVAVG